MAILNPKIEPKIDDFNTSFDNPDHYNKEGKYIGPYTVKRYDERFDKRIAEDTITSESMLPVKEVEYKTPEETPIYPMDKLDSTVPDFEMTEPEKTESEYRSRIADINNQLLGESEYRTEQEDAQGMTELVKTQTDLSNQLKMIQAETKQIPLQMQEEATGRGITAGGLAPLETARLRTNTIQALGVSALLQASQGNITTAQSLVDRAVAAKFDPIREKRTALTNNLNLIIDSPEYSVADKNRAKAQLEAQTAIEEREAQEEADQKTIWNLGVQAAETGANAQVLQAIQNAKTPEEAMQLATQAGVFMTDEEKSLIMEGYTKLSGPSQLQGLTEQDIKRMPNGNIYKKPEMEVDATVQAYVNQVRSGKLKLVNVPATIRNDVALAMEQSGATQTLTKTTPKKVEYTTEEKAFDKDLKAEMTKLQRGGDWGKTWNFLMNKYGDQGLTNEQLDAILDKDKYYEN